MSTKYKTRAARRKRRHMRVRHKVSGTADRPRMAVYKSDKHVYVQFIDDDAGTTLASASTLTKELRSSIKPNMSGAEVLGTAAAENAKNAGISKVIFDRGGFPFHGKVKAVADAARAAGLEF
jgi:large subunit ribosomal protein L18